MRAPAAAPPIPGWWKELTDAEWQSIKHSLAAVGIEDAPLRDQLQWMAASGKRASRRLKDFPTPHQGAAQLKKTVDKLLEAVKLLEPDRCDYPLLDVELFSDMQAMRRELMEFVPKLEGHRHILMDMGSSRGKRTRKASNEFMRKLTAMWIWLDPRAGNFKRKHLQRFLFACSNPFFPDVTDETVEAFIDHHFEHQQKNLTRPTKHVARPTKHDHVASIRAAIVRSGPVEPTHVRFRNAAARTAAQSQQEPRASSPPHPSTARCGGGHRQEAQRNLRRRCGGHVPSAGSARAARRRLA